MNENDMLNDIGRLYEEAVKKTHSLEGQAGSREAINASNLQTALWQSQMAAREVCGLDPQTGIYMSINDRVARAARELSCRRMGFGEFRRIVRENS